MPFFYRFLYVLFIARVRADHVFQKESHTHGKKLAVSIRGSTSPSMFRGEAETSPCEGDRFAPERVAGMVRKMQGGGSLLRGLPFIPQIQTFNFIPGPGGPSQKLQTGFDTRVIIKTPDADDSSHFIPAITFYQLGQNHFQSDAVKRIIGLLVSHVSARLTC